MTESTESTATQQPSDTDPHEWSAALMVTVGGWIDFLNSPSRLEARAVWLRDRRSESSTRVVSDNGLGYNEDPTIRELERENPVQSLGALIDRLGELADDPGRLETRVVALRAADEAAEASEAKWGKAGSSWLDHGYLPSDITGA